MTLKDVVGIHTLPVIIAAWKMESIIPGGQGTPLVIHAELTAAQRLDLRRHLDAIDAGFYDDKEGECAPVTISLCCSPGG